MEKALTGIFPWIVLFGVMWFVMIRPQQKRQREYQQMVDSLKKGDRVLTRGGIHGTIAAIQDDRLRLRIANGVEVTLSRNGVSGKLAEEAEDKN